MWQGLQEIYSFCNRISSEYQLIKAPLQEWHEKKESPEELQN